MVFRSALVARCLVVFLMALLPLRGWAAERMVFTNDRSGTTTMQTVAYADCAAMHGQLEPTERIDHHPDDSGKAHAGCHDCQLCMPLVAIDDVTSVAVDELPHGQPLWVSQRFDSAETARSVKPPIS